MPRRQAFALLRNHEIVRETLRLRSLLKLRTERELHTKSYKMGWRQGDGAPLSLVELATFHIQREEEVGRDEAKEAIGKVAPKKKGKEKRKRRKKRKKKKEKRNPKRKKKRKKIERRKREREKVRRRKKKRRRRRRKKRKKKSEGKQKIIIIFSNYPSKKGLQKLQIPFCGKC